jgi:hypothetical protein
VGLAWLLRHWDGGQSTRLIMLVLNMQKLWCGCGYLARYRCFCEKKKICVGWGKKKKKMGFRCLGGPCGAGVARQTLGWGSVDAPYRAHSEYAKIMVWLSVFSEISLFL